MQKILALNAHIKELKIRTFYVLLSYATTFYVCFMYKVELFYTIAKPFVECKRTFIFTRIIEAFTTYFELCLFGSLFFVYPLMIYLYFFYFAKSLHTTQLQLIWVFLTMLYMFSILTASLSFNNLLPAFLDFFLFFERNDPTSILVIALEAKIDEYLKLVLTFCYFFFFFMHAIMIAMLFILFKPNTKTKKHSTLFYVRKYLYAMTAVLFVVTAPPDFTLQMLILPVIVIFLETIIYFISFFLTLITKATNGENRIRTCDG